MKESRADGLPGLLFLCAGTPEWAMPGEVGVVFGKVRPEAEETPSISNGNRAEQTLVGVEELPAIDLHSAVEWPRS